MPNATNAQGLSAHPEIEPHTRVGRQFSSLAAELKQHQGWVIGVLDDLAYAGLETPPTLRYEHIASVWGSYPSVRVVPLDAHQIRSYQVLFQGKMDVLVFPYGSLFPMDTFRFYSGQTFTHYLQRGGAVLTTGGIPFMKQSSPGGESLSTATPDEMTAVYDRWVAKFGVKYYETPILPTRQIVNTIMLPSLPPILPVAPNRYGVLVNNSAHEPLPKPPHGNVFPERTPARLVTPLITGADRFGSTVSTSAVLVQDFFDGSRRIHFTHESDLHPLSPGAPWFTALIQDIFDLLTNQVTAVSIESRYACYRQGEAVNLRGICSNSSAQPQAVTLRLEILDDQDIVYTCVNEAALAPGHSTFTWNWIPSRFNCGEYTLRLSINNSRRTLSQVENAFVVWDDQVLQQHSMTFGKHQEYFTINKRGSFITGANYYESTGGEIMWFRPAVNNIIRDFRQMQSCRVNMIRPHTHHLKWFKDYILYHHGQLLPFYQELEGLEDPMPDERGWRIWDLFIYLSQKYGMIYNGDLFTLVPAEMGDPRGWFGTIEAVYDPNQRVVQKTFLQALEARYRCIPGISWDLFNEPYQIPDADVAAWALDLCRGLSEQNPSRIITVGGPFDLGAAVDYDSPHGRVNVDFTNRRGRPVLLQELHIDVPEPLAAEIEQAETLRRIFIESLSSGLAGLCPWSWTRQMRLWQDSYEHHHSFPMEKWDDRLGLNTHEDSTLKVAGQVFKDLALFLQGIEFVQYDPIHRVTNTARGKLLAQAGVATNQAGCLLLHTHNEQCFAGMARQKLSWQGKPLLHAEAKGYIYFYVLDGDFFTAQEMFVKSEGAGKLAVARRGAKSVTLVDGAPPTLIELASVNFEEINNCTWLDLDPEMTRYWLRIRF